MNDEILIPKPTILGPDGTPIEHVTLDDAKARLSVHEAEQRGVELGEAIRSMDRRRWRAFKRELGSRAHAAKKPHRMKKLAARRAKNAVAKKSRKANR